MYKLQDATLIKKNYPVLFRRTIFDSLGNCQEQPTCISRRCDASQNVSRAEVPAFLDRLTPEFLGTVFQSRTVPGMVPKPVFVTYVNGISSPGALPDQCVIARIGVIAHLCAQNPEIDRTPVQLVASLRYLQ